MYPELFHIGPVTIYAWGAMLALALLLLAFLLSRRFRAEGINPDYALDLLLITVLAGLIGSRLFYVFFYDWSYYRTHPLQIFSIGAGGLQGLVWYGGFFAGALAFYFYIRWRKLSFWNMADLLAPYLALGYAIVRVGCFLNGCCYGVCTTAPWGVVFPGAGDLPRHPTQLYSTLINLAIFAILLRLYQRRTYKGEVFLAYLALYSLYRFIIEFFRVNLMVGNVLTISQWIALGTAIVTAGLYVYWKKRGKKLSTKGCG